jgi:hypothetical protein
VTIYDYPDAHKKYLPNKTSPRSTARTGNDNSSSRAVIATAHTNRGIRSGLMLAALQKYQWAGHTSNKTKKRCFCVRLFVFSLF